MTHDIAVVTVFADGPGGGNPAPVVLDARGMSDAEMQDVAVRSGHESAFVLPAPEDSTADLALRFWVPGHEMEMCGHATVGAVWLLATRGEVTGDELLISTASGDVEARIVRDGATVHVEISQPRGTTETLTAEDVDSVVDVLRIDAARLGGGPLLNARTSRTKTLVPVEGVDALDALEPDLDRVEEVCTRLGSTGLYPYAIRSLVDQHVDARQFPQSSGYPEDPSTGIAAAALAFGLLEQGLVERSDRPILIRQGRAMGRPSAMTVRLRLDGDDIIGCWLGGAVELATSRSA